MALLDKRLSITYKAIFPWALAYAALPVAAYLATWLKAALGLPLALLFAGSCVYAIASAARTAQRASTAGAFPKPIDLTLSPMPCEKRNGGALVPVSALVALAVVAVAWCVLGGIGGMWAQSDDWGVRNALYRDLITHTWPVYYNGGSAAMSYYMAFWLPPAAIPHMLCASGVALETAWPLANALLLLWSACGVFLVELLALATLNTRTGKAAMFAIGLLVFFATPDALGLPFSEHLRWSYDHLHIEWWAYGEEAVAQYSSITTCLFWVFNQSIVPWICVLCFLNETSFRNYLLLWLCCFNCGPMPSIGFAALMIAQGIGVLAAMGRSEWADGEGARAALRGIISLQNMAALAVFPFIFLYFQANSAVASTGATADVANLLPYPLWFPDDSYMAFALGAFIVIEGLLLPALIARDNMKRPLFWGMVVCLAICPFLRIGVGADFSMRASIPAVLVLYALCAKHLAGHWPKRHAGRAITTYALAVCLAFGSITPLVEFYRGFHQVAAQGGVDAALQDGGTLEGRQDFGLSNFGTDHPDDTVFFRCLAG